MLGVPMTWLNEGPETRLLSLWGRVSWAVLSTGTRGVVFLTWEEIHSLPPSMQVTSLWQAPETPVHELGALALAGRHHVLQIPPETSLLRSRGSCGSPGPARARLRLEPLGWRSALTLFLPCPLLCSGTPPRVCPVPFPGLNCRGTVSL